MLRSKFVKFLMSFLKAQVSFPSNFASIFSAIKHNSSVLFSSNIIYFGQKQPIKVQIFEIFECLGQNLSNSSCHFWKHKSVFLQTLYQSWMPSNITLLYFLSSNIIYFDQKHPIKVYIFKIFECSGQNLLNSSRQFWTDK